MSWNDYLTNLQSQGMKHAVIGALDKSWIVSSDPQVSHKTNVFLCIQTKQIVLLFIVWWHSSSRHCLFKAILLYLIAV